MQGTVLVVGSYPPIPGHAAGVTLAATRRAYADGQEVVVVAPRLGAAHRRLRIEGAAAGTRLDMARGQHGTRGLVLCMEAGMPIPLDRGRQQLAAVGGLADAMDRFDQVTVVVSGDLKVDPALLSPLWAHVDDVLFDGEAGTDGAAVASALGLEARRLVTVPRPGPETVALEPGAADPLGGDHPEVAVLRRALVARSAAQAQAGRPAGVTLFGPPEVLLRQRPRQAISITARAVLGPAAPIVRRGLVRARGRVRGS